MESVQENETNKILWHFVVETDHLIPARTPDLVLINTKKITFHSVDFAILANPNKKSKKAYT